jgi:hypothetical protein
MHFRASVNVGDWAKKNGFHKVSPVSGGNKVEENKKE